MVNRCPWGNNSCIHLVPKQSHPLLDFLIRLQTNESLGKSHLLICSVLAQTWDLQISGMLTFPALVNLNSMCVDIDRHKSIPDMFKDFVNCRLEFKGAHVQDLHDPT